MSTILNNVNDKIFFPTGQIAPNSISSVEAIKMAFDFPGNLCKSNGSQNPRALWIAKWLGTKRMITRKVFCFPQLHRFLFLFLCMKHFPRNLKQPQPLTPKLYRWEEPEKRPASVAWVGLNDLKIPLYLSKSMAFQLILIDGYK